MILGPYLLGPNDTPENGIYVGDARILSVGIPDESVDLIFTDPVYQNIDDYRWLAETAARVLKDRSNLLAWTSMKAQYEAVPVLGQKLEHCWTFSAMVHGASARLFHYHLFTKRTPLIWCRKGKGLPYRWIMDTRTALLGYDRFLLDKQSHGWQKHPEFIAYYLEAFTQPNSVVFDPFTGGGTVPAVCKMLGRKYLAFEIDPGIAEEARERGRNTQPPLFVPAPEQITLPEMFAAGNNS